MTDYILDQSRKTNLRVASRGGYTSQALRSVETNTLLKSRNIVVHGRRTSVRLEPAMWDALRDISLWERQSINEIVSAIGDCDTRAGSLTSAIRIFVMAYFRARSHVPIRDVA